MAWCGTVAQWLWQKERPDAFNGSDGRSDYSAPFLREWRRRNHSDSVDTVAALGGKKAIELDEGRVVRVQRSTY